MITIVCSSCHCAIVSCIGKACVIYPEMVQSQRFPSAASASCMVGRKGTGTGLEVEVQKEGKPTVADFGRKLSTASHVVFESRVVLRIQEFEVHCVGSAS
jgi:hypothetical protein